MINYVFIAALITSLFLIGCSSKETGGGYPSIPPSVIYKLDKAPVDEESALNAVRNNIRSLLGYIYLGENSNLNQEDIDYWRSYHVVAYTDPAHDPYVFGQYLQDATLLMTEEKFIAPQVEKVSITKESYFDKSGTEYIQYFLDGRFMGANLDDSFLEKQAYKVSVLSPVFRKKENSSVELDYKIEDDKLLYKILTCENPECIEKHKGDVGFFCSVSEEMLTPEGKCKEEYIIEKWKEQDDRITFYILDNYILVFGGVIPMPYSLYDDPLV